MRRVRLRVEKRRVVDPPDLPEDFEGDLLLTDEDVEGRSRVLRETNRAYAALKGDKQAWDEELKERAAWEGTLDDGLEPNKQGGNG